MVDEDRHADRLAGAGESGRQDGATEDEPAGPGSRAAHIGSTRIAARTGATLLAGTVGLVGDEPIEIIDGDTVSIGRADLVEGAPAGTVVLDQPAAGPHCVGDGDR